MLHYILQTIILQLLFLLIYDVLLKKETFFNWNRFYLLASSLLCIVLPFVKITSFKNVIPKEYIYSLPEVLIGNSDTTNIINKQEVISAIEATSAFIFSWSYILYLGCIIALILFAIKLYKLIIMVYRNPKVRFENLILVELANSKHAFSFFNYIFLGKDINKEDRQSILTHELQHVRENHSLDLLFFEILKIIFWFNPLVYLYQKRIAILHEFIADSKAVKSISKANYYQNLLSQVFDTKKVLFINPFFKQSLIKKRIIMLSKSKSKKIHLTKYLLVFPMVIGMLFYTSCSREEKVTEEAVSVSQQIKVLKQSLNGRKLTKQETSRIFEILHQNAEVSNKFYKVVEETKVEEISLSEIDQVPVFPGCDISIPKDDQKKCFSDKINKLVTENFNIGIAKSLRLKGKLRITANFIINKVGKITNVRIAATHLELEKETKRVINLIPQLLPGKQDEKPVNVTFKLPIIFNIQE